MTASTCSKAECGAPIGDDGYCTRCGTAVRSPVLPPPDADAPTAPALAERVATSPLVVSGSRRNPLVNLRELPTDDHLATVLADPAVPEHKRFCPNPECRQQVGRARNG